jgi:hypothetical protein
VVERIFGVLKKQWDILNRPPQYDISIQAHIPAGLAAVHNFIVNHDVTDIEHHLQDVDTHEHTQSLGDLGHGAIPQAESERASTLHDSIATEMWESYQQVLQDHSEELEDMYIYSR